MTITPLGHRVLVKPQQLEEVDEVYARAKKAGLTLLEKDERAERTAIDKGTVIAIGETAFKDYGGAPWCKVGDLVAYAKYSGKVVKDGDTDYIVMNDEDLVAKLGE